MTLHCSTEQFVLADNSLLRRITRHVRRSSDVESTASINGEAVSGENFGKFLSVKGIQSCFGDLHSPKLRGVEGHHHYRGNNWSLNFKKI